MRTTAARALALALTLLAGCSAETRQKLLPLVFDGVPEEGRPAPPPTARVRQDLQRENEELRREIADLRAAAQSRAEGTRRAEAEQPAERARTWEEARQLLPRDASGEVDWTKALEAGAIRPRPGAEPGASAPAVFDLDVEVGRGGHPFFAATLRHATHTRWLACGSCHPAPYPLGSGTPRPRFGMAAIRAGRGCGVCHGRVEFGIERECARCHSRVPITQAWQPREGPGTPLERARTWADAAKLLPETAGTPDWDAARAQGLLALRPGPQPGAVAPESLDLDVERVPQEDKTRRVVFRHASHSAWLACESCHPALFQMQAGATPVSMDALLRGELCGVCHGKVAFPVEACDRCHPANGG